MEVDAAAPVAPFVQQLFKLVTEGMHIHWAADGAALVIPDTAKFAADRCPVYFKHSNWTSFARMLNMYEFRRRKSADGSAIFAHPHFTRDGARLARVVRKKRASSSSWEDVDALGKSLAAEDVARAAASGVDWRHTAWKSNLTGPTPSRQYYLGNCICSMAWRVHAIDAT